MAKTLSNIRRESKTRLHNRFMVPKGTFVIVSPGTDKEWKVQAIDISHGGLAFIVPVLKVASTSRMYNQMEDDMDINAGVILEGTPMQEVVQHIIELVRKVLNGEQTKAEVNKQEGIVCLYTLHPAF